MSVWLIGVLIVAAIAAVVVMRGLQMKRLANEGVVIEGKVIERKRSVIGTSGRSRATLKYEYFPPGGQRFERSSVVSTEVYDRYQEGDAFDVVYVPGKPAVSGPRYMVNLSRQALKLPPL